ncbi:MAG TPA: anti-sigma factor [Solirubrobacterales bacterium]|nr:anti-sigma factor [Solirubrobacterales bacterium]
MNETEHDRRRDDVAAYLLGALGPGEAAELERHIAACPECEEELERLRPAVQVLPETVEPVEAPAALRNRLMEQVRSEAGDSQEATATRRTPRWQLGLRPLAGLAALALVVAAIGGYAISDSGSGGAKTTTVITGHSPGVTAQMVREGETGTLRLANLHQLPAGKVLQAWVQRGKQVVSAKALFVPNSDGTATATIDGMNGVNTVMVTAEPRGGSVQPTGKPIVSVAIPN